jgi:hypothetical protein
MAINTIEPSPTEETSDDGKLSFELGPIAAVKTFVLYMQFQVNPTNVAGTRRTLRCSTARHISSPSTAT